MPSVTIQSLEKYRVDRQTGMTVDGSTELVVLLLKPFDAPEVAFALSKVDAMMLAHALTMGALDAQQLSLR
jgi:hypothetical protein